MRRTSPRTLKDSPQLRQTKENYEQLLHKTHELQDKTNGFIKTLETDINYQREKKDLDFFFDFIKNFKIYEKKIYDNTNLIIQAITQPLPIKSIDQNLNMQMLESKSRELKNIQEKDLNALLSMYNLISQIFEIIKDSYISLQILKQDDPNITISVDINKTKEKIKALKDNLFPILSSLSSSVNCINRKSLDNELKQLLITVDKLEKDLKDKADNLEDHKTTLFMCLATYNNLIKKYNTFRNISCLINGLSDKIKSYTADIKEVEEENEKLKQRIIEFLADENLKQKIINHKFLNVLKGKEIKDNIYNTFKEVLSLMKSLDSRPDEKLFGKVALKDNDQEIDERKNFYTGEKNICSEIAEKIKGIINDSKFDDNIFSYKKIIDFIDQLPKNKIGDNNLEKYENSIFKSDYYTTGKDINVGDYLTINTKYKFTREGRKKMSINENGNIEVKYTQNQDKILIFGDLHGDPFPLMSVISTIIDKDPEELKNYSIFLLGDVLDPFNGNSVIEETEINENVENYAQDLNILLMYFLCYLVFECKINVFWVLGNHDLRYSIYTYIGLFFYYLPNLNDYSVSNKNIFFISNDIDFSSVFNNNTLNVFMSHSNNTDTKRDIYNILDKTIEISKKIIINSKDENGKFNNIVMHEWTQPCNKYELEGLDQIITLNGFMPYRKYICTEKPGKDKYDNHFFLYGHTNDKTNLDIIFYGRGVFNGENTRYNYMTQIIDDNNNYSYKTSNNYRKYFSLDFSYSIFKIKGMIFNYGGERLTDKEVDFCGPDFENMGYRENNCKTKLFYNTLDKHIKNTGHILYVNGIYIDDSVQYFNCEVKNLSRVHLMNYKIFSGKDGFNIGDEPEREKYNNATLIYNPGNIGYQAPPPSNQIQVEVPLNQLQAVNTTTAVPTRTIFKINSTSFKPKTTTQQQQQQEQQKPQNDQGFIQIKSKTLNIQRKAKGGIKTEENAENSLYDKYKEIQTTTEKQIINVDYIEKLIASGYDIYRHTYENLKSLIVQLFLKNKIRENYEIFYKFYEPYNLAENKETITLLYPINIFDFGKYYNIVKGEPEKFINGLKDMLKSDEKIKKHPLFDYKVSEEVVEYSYKTFLSYYFNDIKRFKDDKKLYLIYLLLFYYLEYSYNIFKNNISISQFEFVISFCSSLQDKKLEEYKDYLNPLLFNYDKILDDSPSEIIKQETKETEDQIKTVSISSNLQDTKQEKEQEMRKEFNDSLIKQQKQTTQKNKTVLSGGERKKN